MDKKEKKNDIIFVLCLLLFIGIAAAVSVKRVFFGLDIDEEYSITLIYRLAMGDIPIKELWEPHQTSAMIMALPAALFIKITGSATYLVIFLRIFGIIIQSLVSAGWYKFFSKRYGKYPALTSAFLAFLFLPKWILSPEFNNMQVWFLELSVITLLSTIESGKKSHAVLAGLFLTLEAMAYPTCATIFIFALIVMYKKNKKQVPYISIVPAMSLIFLATYVLIKGGSSDLGKCISNILSDSAHSGSRLGRMTQFSGLAETIVLLIVYALISLIIICISNLISSKKAFSRQNLPCFCMILISILCMDQLRNWALLHSYLVVPGAFYIAIFIAGIAIHTFDRTNQNKSNNAENSNRDNDAFSLIYGMTTLAFISVLLLTNLDIRAVYAHLSPAVLYTVMVIMSVATTKKETICKTLSVSFLLITVIYSQFMLLRVSNEGRYEDINLVRQKSLYGASKFVYCEYLDGYENNQNHEFITPLIPEGSKVLYAGLHNAIYTLGEYEVCSPSTISTPSYGDNVSAYYSINPDKYPDYVIISKGIKDNREIIQAGFETWLAENTEFVSESDYLIIYKTH